MSTALFFISFIGLVIFIVLGLISKFKKNGKAKRNFLISGACFVIMIISFIAVPVPETEPTMAQKEETDTVKEKQVKSTSKDTNTQVTDKESDTTASKDTKAEKEVVKEEPKKDDGKIKDGTYKVGTDIPAGEYLVFSKGMAYIESASDSTGTLDSIIFNDNLTSNAHSYVTLQDGQYFKMQGADMYPVTKAPSVIPGDGLYKNGMYKVGQDIPAGEYKVVLDSALGFGYLEVSSNSSHQLDNIVTNENVQADMYITVSDGQYLKLQDVTIQK